MESRNTPTFWENSLPLWQSEQNNTLVCCQIKQETADVKSFFFKPLTPSIFAFLPGQFITLELPIAGEIINRSYTISSSPTHPHTISITVKRKPNGLVSNWLHDNMQIGLQISVLGPTGDFTCTNHPAKKYLLLSGGSGITPLMSMSRAFYDLAEATDIVFMHSARTPADIIFKHELDLIALNQPLTEANFKTVYLCEKIDKTPNWRLQPEFISEGLLSIENLKLNAPDFLTREVFTCGPAPYMAAVRAMLLAAGFDMQHYHEESFTFDEVAPAALAVETKAEADNQSALAPEKTSGLFTITLLKSDVTVQCAPDQFVLDAAKTAGLRLPSSCSKGLCGTCKSKLVSGQVDMKHGGGIRQREIDQGLFLPCCSKPLSDLVIER